MIVDCPCCEGTGYNHLTPPEFIEEYGYSWSCDECGGLGWVQKPKEKQQGKSIFPPLIQS